jgi:hypothetical protein
MGYLLEGLHAGKGLCRKGPTPPPPPPGFHTGRREDARETAVSLNEAG